MNEPKPMPDFTRVCGANPSLRPLGPRPSALGTPSLGRALGAIALLGAALLAIGPGGMVHGQDEAASGQASVKSPDGAVASFEPASPR